MDAASEKGQDAKDAKDFLGWVGWKRKDDSIFPSLVSHNKSYFLSFRLHGCFVLIS